ncbi:mitochondrial fission ELM1 family protein [Candidatus Puniceispirillum sp.]|nr:mitochondrial fission ELM1 family protein [Candidatus Puniceispirillum sp.]
MPKISHDTTVKKTLITESLASSIWVMSDGTPGMRLQAIALGQALQANENPIAKLEDIILTPPWLLRHIPRLAKALPLSWLRAMIEPVLQKRLHEFLTFTIVVTCGRRMAGLSIAMQRLGREDANKKNWVKRVRTIHIQDPRLSPSHFDVLIVPQHDQIRGPNVVTSMASLNRLNNANITDAARKLESKWSKLPAPRVAVLLGGNNRRYDISITMVCEMAERLKKFASTTGTSLALIPSQRTPGELLNHLTQALEQIPHAVANPKDKNPYPGILGIVEAIIVTSDSVNLTSEAVITGKPVLIAKWRQETGRIAAFHDAMMSAGHTMTLDNSVPIKTFTPLDEMPAILRQVIGLLYR